MAAPITHIALTAKIFDTFFKDKVKRDFFIGTCFPDIRYLKVIEKEKTHFKDLSLADLKSESSFISGLKFHSILDIAREKFIVENDTYSLCPQSKYITHSLKLLEDELYYDEIGDFSEYINCLNEVLPDEINMGVSEKDIKKWHMLQTQYFQAKPSNKSITDFMVAINFTQEAIEEIFKNVRIMKKNKEIISILKKLYKNFDTLIT